jgi:hypothetical protein
VTTEWISRLAADERKRDDARTRVADVAARKADLVRVHGQRLLNDLRSTMVRDIEMFREEFPGDEARELIIEADEADGPFVVRKPAFPTAALTIAPLLSTASIACEYRFTPNNGLPSRADRVELRLTSDDDDTVRFKHGGTGQMFATADALSEYLLVPVLTGRPR